MPPVRSPATGSGPGGVVVGDAGVLGLSPTLFGLAQTTGVCWFMLLNDILFKKAIGMRFDDKKGNLSIPYLDRGAPWKMT